MNWKLLFFCFYSAVSMGQGELAFRNYSLGSGLPSNTVYETFQDKKGYIYIGHNNGCSIFNGLSFLVPKLEGKSSALSNFISFSNGQLMCRNFQGKQYILKNNQLTPFESSLNEAWGFPTYLQDGDKHYVFQSGSFYTLDENGKGEEIKFPKDIGRIFYGVVQDDKIYLFVALKHAHWLFCYDLKLNKIIASREFDAESNVKIFKSRKDIFWLSDRSGECGKYENGFITLGNLYNAALPKDSKITSFLELDGGDKLISTFNGIYRLNKHWKFVNHYLDGIQCTHLLLDKNKGLWVSSLQNGLFFVPNTDVIQINSSYFEGRNVKYSKVYSCNNFMYVGTYDGRIFRFNERGELIQIYDFHRNVEIQSMHISGNTLFTYCGGLLKVDLKSSEVKQETVMSACKSIYVSGDELICGSSKGLIIADKNKQTIYLDTLWIKNVLPISRNVYLLESAENIYTFNRESQKLKLVQTGGTNSCALGNQWFFRTENTVYVLDPNLQKRKTYSSHTAISKLYVTDEMLTLDMSDNRSIQLTGKDLKRQKLLANCVLSDVSFAGEIGSYRFKGNSSVIQLIPKSAKLSEAIPSVQLAGEIGNFTFENQKYLLPYHDNELTLQFDVLPNYQYTGEGILYYRILELNGEWKAAQKKEHYTIELLRIPPGEYSLEVYGVSNGINSPIHRIKMSIEQPYFAKWWFIILVFLGIVGIIYFIVRWRAQLIQAKNNRILKEQELKLNALNSELTAIRSQMNPHFIFNSLSSIQTKILNEDRVEAYKNLNTFSTLLRQALQFTSKEFLSLTDEISFTRNYILLEQTRTSDAFDYKEEIDSNLNADSERIPSLFLQPFVENAIRHGLMHSKNEKCLCIQISAIENGFRVIIEDNGVGRSESNRINHEQRPEHESFATNAIQDRITILKETKKMNIDLKIIDLEKGTRVEINFMNHEDK